MSQFVTNCNINAGQVDPTMVIISIIMIIIITVTLIMMTGLIKCGNFATYCYRYYKVPQLLQSASEKGEITKLFMHFINGALFN